MDLNKIIAKKLLKYAINICMFIVIFFMFLTFYMLLCNIIGFPTILIGSYKEILSYLGISIMVFLLQISMENQYKRIK